MIHSTQQDDVHSELFKTLQGVDSKKKQLDELRMHAATQLTILCCFFALTPGRRLRQAVRATQELPEIADTHRVDLQKAKEAAEAAAEKTDKL